MFKLFQGRDEVYDEPYRKQEQAARENPLFAASDLGDFGDALPNGYGPFGSITNPVPVNGVVGEVVYLNRLATVEGSRFLFHRPGCFKTDVSEYPVDGFELVSFDGKCKLNLWLSPYHKRRSKLSPEGCRLNPFPKDKLEQIMVKLPGYGTTGRVEGFPFGLPDSDEYRRRLDALMPDLSTPMAESTRRVLDELTGVTPFERTISQVGLGAQEAEGGDIVFLCDEDERIFDVGIIGHRHTMVEVESILREAEEEGLQALMMVAMLDERNLSSEEREYLASHFGVAPLIGSEFSMHFAFRWLQHELQDRPVEDGTYGSKTLTRRLVHWADLPVPEVPMSRKCRRILNSLVARRS